MSEQTLSMLFSLIFWSGFGLPLGVPPEKEDPLLASVAPADCLFYSTWSGMAAADPQSTNQAEQLLAEPEVKRLVAEIEKAIPLLLDDAARDAHEPKLKELGQDYVPLAKMLLTRSGALFVSKLKLEGEQVHGQGALLLNVGENGPQVSQLIARLLAESEDLKVSEVQIAGAKFHRVLMDQEEFTLGVKGRYLVLGWGPQAVENLFARAGNAPPAWLEKVRADLPVERRSTLSYLNLQFVGEMLLDAEKQEKLKALTEELAAPVNLRELAKSLGLENVAAYESVTGLNATGFVSRTLYTFQGDPQGLLAFAGAKPLTLADLEPLPGHTTTALVVRFHAAALYDTLLDAAATAAKASGGPGKDEFEKQLAEYEDSLGFKVRDDLLDGLGDVWYFYNEPGGGGLLTGWTLGVSVRDKAKLQKVQDALIAISGIAAPKGLPPAGAAPAEAGPEFEPSRRGELRQFEMAGAPIYHVDLTSLEIPLSPAWCLTDRTLVFGLYPQSLTAFLNRNAKMESLAQKPEVKQLFEEENKPLLCSYTDTRAIFELVYPFGLMGLEIANHYLERETLAFDPSLIPSATSISRHLQPALTVVRRHKEGVEVYQYQTLPGSSLGSTVAVGTALTLPAVQAARKAAQRTQSANNLRQVTLALHNFADSNRGLPAAYNTSKDGKPLLSWRVHLLPYLEAEPLYEEFHFDEPWDSEHNKKLIEQMPATFRSPKSKAPAGYTTYLAVRGKDAVLVPPDAKKAGAKHPTGIDFGAIADGTSNTIALVEVNDAAAVPWTKPDDYEYDAKTPAKALQGVWPGGFHAAFADGHIQFLSDQLPAEKLAAFFTRSGGEAVDLDTPAPGLPERKAAPEAPPDVDSPSAAPNAAPQP